MCWGITLYHLFIGETAYPLVFIARKRWWKVIAFACIVWIFLNKTPLNNGFTVLFFKLPLPHKSCFPTFHQQLVLSAFICNLSAYLIIWECWMTPFVIAEISGSISFSQDKVCSLCATYHFTIPLSLWFLLKLLRCFIFHCLIYMLIYFSSSVSPI